MNKIFTTIGLLAGVLSCTGKRQSGDANGANALTFDTIRVLEKIKLLEYGIDTLPRAEVFIELIYPKSCSPKTDLKKLQSLFYEIIFDEENDSPSSLEQTLERYIKSYTEEYRENARYFEEELKESPHVDMADEHRHYNYSPYTRINNEIDFYNKSLLNFTSNFESVQSGRITREIKYSSIDLISTKKLTEADIFNSGYKEELAPIIRNKLLEAVMELFGNVESDRDPKNSFYDFYTIYANGNFMIDDKGLHYIYNQDEVTPPIFGTFEIDIAFQEVAHLLNPEILSSMGINTQDNRKKSGVRNKTGSMAQQEETNRRRDYSEFPIAYVKEGGLYFFNPENQTIKRFTEEADSVFNCVYSDKNNMFYYMVSKNGMLSFKEVDLAVTPIQISLLKGLKSATQDFFSETYGEKAALSFINNNLLLECDFEWDYYSFSKYLEYSIDWNTLSKLDGEMFYEKYINFIEREGPDTDYNPIFDKAKPLVISEEQIDGDELEYYLTEESADKSKIIFAILVGFGDLPHGPYCVANADGSMMKLLNDTDMGSKFKPVWCNNNAVYIRKREIGEYEYIKELCYTIASTNEVAVIDSNVDYYAVRINGSTHF